jgi:hypothetical protein
MSVEWLINATPFAFAIVITVMAIRVYFCKDKS